ncbi:LysR family transcriptional regulator [Pollutimonas bauzanensis]|uniref:DNA-binding transcriptional regulator, LysR family n=1 Tax=Pollutimonas bauzanensis TaxID=658167 RepID=A0A1M5R5H1_9BURK|nr:LysR family transcriptional regulator [Pollutimonas bauzanensis]SHH21615.1 DNA-binding transcriptional regulator, LysR family [Pollutimonas bauzanensis]
MKNSASLVNRLRLKQFEMLCGVADGYSFRMLAESMSLSQPAISKIAREMESALGEPIFQRKREGVALTPFGQSLVHHARLVLKQIARMESKTRQQRDGKDEVLRLGSPSYTGVSLLAKPIAQLVAQHPGLRVEMSDGIADTLFTLLKTGEIDFIIGSLPAKPITDEEAALLHVEVLYPDELSIITNKETKYKSPVLQLKDLQSCSWVLPLKDSLIRGVLRKAMLDAQLPVPSPAVETSFIPAIGALIAEQPNLVGALRSDAAHYLSQRLGLTILQVRPKIPLPAVAIIRLKDAEPTAMALALFALIRQRVASLLS